MKVGLAERAGVLAIFLLAAPSGCGDVAPPAPPPAFQELAFDTLFTIGGMAGGEAGQAFGGIWDIATSPSGYLAVLDIETSQVHVYDRDGAHVGSIIETGMDPGALAAPYGLAWRSRNELLVWDPGSSWISRFTVGGSGVRFVDRFRAFAFGETGFCARGDRTYLSYFNDGMVIHELGTEGPARSFGAAPDIPGVETLGTELQEIAIEELTPSRLLCGSGGVLDVSFFGSRLRFHRADGTLAWTREFADFNPLVVYTPDGIGLGRQFDPTEGTHLLRSVVGWGPDLALVQHELLREEYPQDGEVEVIESRLIRLADGVEVDRTRELPFVLATWGTRLYVPRNQPFPQVLVIDVAPAPN
jgi:hypothetical protein